MIEFCVKYFGEIWVEIHEWYIIQNTVSVFRNELQVMKK